jgi:CHAT domain-containing protein
MKVGNYDLAVAATKKERNIIVYAIGEEAYEAELVESTSHGGENQLANDRHARKSSKLMKDAIVKRRRNNRMLSASVSMRPSSTASQVASNKPFREAVVSTNPFDDQIQFDERKADRIMCAHPIAGTNPFDE